MDVGCELVSCRLTSSRLAAEMVRKEGVEPSWLFSHRILSPARLPVPPLSRGFACALRVSCRRHPQSNMWPLHDASLGRTRAEGVSPADRLGHDRSSGRPAGRRRRPTSGHIQVVAPYRVPGDVARTSVCSSPRAGALTSTLVGYDGHFPTDRPVAIGADRLRGRCRLRRSTSPSGEVGDRRPQRGVTASFPRGGGSAGVFELVADRGTETARLTGHYRPADGRPVDRVLLLRRRLHRLRGTESRRCRRAAAALARVQRRRAAARDRLRDRSAAGGAGGANGYDVTGVDFSEWAVEQASAALGPGRAFKADVEADGFPAAMVERAPFGIVIIWMVLEHFRDPFAVLAVAARADAAWLARSRCYTTNADSLSHRIFGDDWEGYFDWTHHGVDRVSAASLRAAFTPPGVGSAASDDGNVLGRGCGSAASPPSREWFERRRALPPPVDRSAISATFSSVSRRHR